MIKAGDKNHTLPCHKNFSNKVTSILVFKSAFIIVLINNQKMALVSTFLILKNATYWSLHYQVQQKYSVEKQKCHAL